MFHQKYKILYKNITICYIRYTWLQKVETHVKYIEFPIFTRSQANDMAIQLARAYTGNHDVIIFEESFHGGLSTGADMSAKVFMKVLFIL